MDDPFIRTYMDDVIKNIRSQVLIKLIKPYTRIKLSFASKVRKIIVYQIVKYNISDNNHINCN